MARTVTVSEESNLVAERAGIFARLYDFRPATATDRLLEFKRGGLLGDLISFDVQKVSSVLRIELETSERGTRVTAILEAKSPFQAFTAGDRSVLEKNMDVLVGILRDQG